MEKIVVDIYGADGGPEIVIRGTADAIKKIGIFPVLVGDADLIKKVMTEKGISADAYEIINTDDFISNNEPATCVFGGRETSSLVLAYNRLKTDDTCVAMISSGNTGAMLVGSICRLGLLPTIKFPALCSALPCAGDKLLTLVDCGAVIDCTALDFVRFAKMGNVFSRCCCGIENPRVGIMSVGREDGKGNALTLEAFKLIKELPLNFIGNLEGSDMVSGYADVIVTDGFSGNILLKNTEATGKKAMEIVSKIAKDYPELAEEINKELFKTFDFNSQGAATFLGTKKIVVKMHGSANENTVLASVEQIIRLQKADFLNEMSKALSN